MGTKHVLDLATDVAIEAGLMPPQSLIDVDEGDTTGPQIKRAMEWVCRYLKRHFSFASAVDVTIATDSDVLWPPDELLHIGTLWKILHGDGVGDVVYASEFHDAVVEYIWAETTPTEPYQSIDSGFPGIP